MEKLCLFLALAFLFNQGICQDRPNSTPKPNRTSKYQPNSTPKNLPSSTPKNQSNSTLKDNLPNNIIVPKSNTTTLATTCIPITTRSVEDCIQNCPVTPEYNPVCGSNNVTYDNPGRLLCAQSCGVNVKLVGDFRCPPPTPAPSAILSSGVLGLSLRNKRQAGEKEELEDRYGWNRPNRPNRPGCGRFSGQTSRRCLGQTFFIFPGQQTNPTTATVPIPNVNGATTQFISVQDCIRICPVTSEYNPVCGSDNVTYDNPGRLRCAQTCGVTVNLVRSSRCPARR